MDSDTPIFRLPIGPRLQIYACLFGLDEWGSPHQTLHNLDIEERPGGTCGLLVQDCFVAYYSKLNSPETRNLYQYFSAILRTRKVINAEASDVLSDRTHFILTIAHRSIRPAWARANQPGKRILLGILESCALLERIKYVSIRAMCDVEIELLKKTRMLDELASKIRPQCRSFSVILEVKKTARCAPIIPEWSDESLQRLIETLAKLKEYGPVELKIETGPTRTRRRLTRVLSEVVGDLS